MDTAARHRASRWRVRAPV